MNIAITGGGTGGHLVIAKSIKEELNKMGHKPVFIGSTYGQDMEWFKDDNGFLEKYFFETSAVVNKGYLGKIKSLANMFKYALKCNNIFKKHNIEAVFSVGGYSAAPASFASILFRKPLYIHEQNAIKGKLNKILEPFSKAFFSVFSKDSNLKYYPIREIFFQNAKIREELKSIIFLGGSQGAVAINNFAIKYAKQIDKNGIKIIHQCGKKDFDRVREFYQNNNIKADVFAFSKELEKKIQSADFAISRAGASTLGELCASNLPALYIPYPYAAENHQYYNALHLKEKNLSFLMTENELDNFDIEQIFKADLKSMSMGLKDVIKKDGAKQIVEYIKKDIAQ
jgi:UDP-N-acetylglucosamine--N-acetylmuramyl-(pentapeptide) pyrophosphoryl-undecaprenol N-acetylglucosamine transferase